MEAPVYAQTPEQAKGYAITKGAAV